MHEARKTVTVLFADVVASTQLGERLDPEALRQVMSRYFAEMAGVVERHGGTVEKFIGDEVMAVFGVPVVREDDALRAVRAAAAMRVRMRTLNADLDERWGARLEIRIGVNTGEVVAGDPSTGHGFITGDAVNVAKRIEQAAAPGEILIGETTSRIVRHAAVLTPRGLSIKGKREGITAQRVEEIDLTSEAVPRRLDAPMVGRTAELGTLLDAYTRAVETRKPGLVTVLGLPGIGKSRLARELLDGVRSEARVRVGRCLPYGEGISFWPVREILPHETFEGTREEIFWRVRKQLEALAAERPLVVCFEDVHWGEPTFLDLVQYLTGWIPEGPVLLLCLARPELLENRPDWPRNEPGATALTLDPLSYEEAAQLLELLDAPDAARERIAVAAEGNPLFVEQTTSMTADEGAEVVVPPSIQAVLAARLDGLERDDRIVLQCAAVVGRDFSLRAALDLVPPELRPGATTILLGLMRKELIRPHALGHEDGFRFRHALIRDAAYDGMAKSLRAELHERHANWLGAARREEVLMGYHLEQAALLKREIGAQNDEAQVLALRASEALHRVGRRAHARGDAPAAASLLDRSVSLLSNTDPQRPALLVELADAQMRLGQFANAAQSLNEATELARVNDDRRIEIRAAIGRRFLHVFTPADASGPELPGEEIISELERLDDNFGLARAWRVLSEADAGACRWEARADALERALSYAAQFPAQRHEASVIATLLVQALHFGPTPATQAARRCRDLLEDADGDLPLQAGIKATLSAVLATQGAFDEARTTYAESAALHDDLGLRVRRAVGTIFAAEIELLGDDPAAAERELLEGYRTLEAMGDTGVRAVIASYLADALWLQGRVEEAASYAAISAEIGDPTDIAAQVLERTTRARLLASAGEARVAETVAIKAIELAEPTDFLTLQAAAALALADVLVADGRGEESRTHVERARDLYEIKQNVIAAERVATRMATPVSKA
ncbi:AAA family ATPase [soil metagenome]